MCICLCVEELLSYAYSNLCIFSFFQDFEAFENAIEVGKLEEFLKI